MADVLYDKLLSKLLKARDCQANYETTRQSLWAEVEAEPEKYLRMFFHNWFTNNWTRPLKQEQERRLRIEGLPPLGKEDDLKPFVPKPYQPRLEETPEQAKERRKRDANLRGLTLLNQFLSDGETRAKDASGAQLRKEGAWFALLAKHIKPKEILGRKLTAEQVANLRKQWEG